MKDEEIIAWIGERTLSDGSTLTCCRAHLISCPDERTVPMKEHTNNGTFIGVRLAAALAHRVSGDLRGEPR